MSKPVSCIIEKKKIMMFPQCHPSLISNNILSTEYAPELASGIKICQWENKCGFLINLSSATAPVRRNRRKTSKVPVLGKYPMLSAPGLLHSVKNSYFLELALDWALSDNITQVSQNKLYFHSVCWIKVSSSILYKSLHLASLSYVCQQSKNVTWTWENTVFHDLPLLLRNADVTHDLKF